MSPENVQYGGESWGIFIYMTFTGYWHTCQALSTSSNTTVYFLWVGSDYSKTGVYSWCGDTSTHLCKNLCMLLPSIYLQENIWTFLHTTLLHFTSLLKTLQWTFPLLTPCPASPATSVILTSSPPLGFLLWWMAKVLPFSCRVSCWVFPVIIPFFG